MPPGTSLLLLLGFFVVVMVFMSRSGKKKQEEAKRKLNEEMVPGVWVRTIGGFYGRVVEKDGDVVVLETPAGVETLWDRAAIQGIFEPPFATSEDDEEVIESEETTAGDKTEAKAKNPKSEESGNGPIEVTRRD